MPPHLKDAIIQFIANEFKLQPETISEDLSFADDLSLSPEEVIDLLQRLQDALDFVLPEDTKVQSLGDLFETIKTDSPEEGSDLV